MKNYRFLNLLFIASMAMLIVSCSQPMDKSTETGKVQHFRNILFSETPWDEIQGTHKITGEQAETVNNYKFVYNEVGQVTSIEYSRGDSLMAHSSLGAAKIIFTYEGNKEIRNYFDKNNTPKKVNGDVFKAVYETNESGFKTGLKFYGEDGQPIGNRNNIAYYIWSKTDDGLIKENRFTLEGEETVLSEFCPFYELRFKYDEKGFITRMANYEADTLYDCTAENCGNIGVSYFDFKLDDHGSLLEFSVHSTTGQMSNLYWGWAKFSNKFDENGYVVERSMYDQDNEFVGGKMIPVRLYSYDESGSILEVKCLDANRQLMNNPRDTVAVTQYKYDELGNNIETLRFDKDMVKKES